MHHSPILLKDLSLCFSHKTCFEGFSATVPYGSKIAIIGQNGQGKSTLLNCVQGLKTLITGVVNIPQDICLGVVPQIIEGITTLSGAERFHQALTRALSVNPNVLLLDEPTNHLDTQNRAALLRMLRSFDGTLILVTHDPHLLNQCVDTLWHIDNGIINIFTGNYTDYQRELAQQRSCLEKEIGQLTQNKKQLHQALMQEQVRAKKSREKGQKSITQRKWPTIVSNAKANRAANTAGVKRAQIATKKQDCLNQLAELSLPEIIKPSFSLDAAKIKDKCLLSISNASIGFQNKPLIQSVSLSVFSSSRIALLGQNGCGKSTLMKAILGRRDIITTGYWQRPNAQEIGFLDQHYGTLERDKTALACLQALAPNWPYKALRLHLTDFLFKKNEEVEAKVAQLSGGEKARLSLAMIGAKTPPLLLLDEITNNLDMQTKEHVIQVLQSYPGAMIVISHDEAFLKAINITEYYIIQHNSLVNVR
ncbi:MAG: ABC-F family ATP-binding cassette domain-containing protein [Proteobacteria bacterium]|nr:ABC-F family ATP-binding cassette domain-containing protein [Pseudomonadota bacterium]